MSLGYLWSYLNRETAADVDLRLSSEKTAQETALN